MSSARQFSPPQYTGRDADLRLGLLGSDLCHLTEKLGSPIVSMRPVTQLPSSASQRASFMLCLADGRVLKGRRVESVRRCSILAAIAPLLVDLPFTRGVAFKGASLLEQWIPGRPFESVDATPERMHEAGEMLGRLSHIRDLPCPELHSLPTPERLMRAIGRWLDDLGALTLLSTSEMRLLRQMACRNLPGELETGLMHHDFCAENLVVTPSGSLHAIDNEDLRHGALDADLARTFHRWPMTEAQKLAFCDGYQLHRGGASYSAHVNFWRLWVLSGAAEFRAKRGLPCNGLVRRLRNLAAGACAP